MNFAGLNKISMRMREFLMLDLKTPLLNLSTPPIESGNAPYWIWQQKVFSFTDSISTGSISLVHSKLALLVTKCKHNNGLWLYCDWWHNRMLRALRCRYSLLTTMTIRVGSRGQRTHYAVYKMHGSHYFPVDVLYYDYVVYKLVNLFLHVNHADRNHDIYHDRCQFQDLLILQFYSTWLLLL